MEEKNPIIAFSDQIDIYCAVTYNYGVCLEKKKRDERVMKNQSQTDQNEVFESYPVPKALRVMIVPAVISQLIVLIYNMADTFYVGQTNNPYMVAGTSLILPVFNISLCLAGLAGIGGGALISRLLGQEKEEEARRVSAFSLYLGIGIAAYEYAYKITVSPRIAGFCVSGICGAGSRGEGRTGVLERHRHVSAAGNELRLRGVRAGDRRGHGGEDHDGG